MWRKKTINKEFILINSYARKETGSDEVDTPFKVWVRKDAIVCIEESCLTLNGKDVLSVITLSHKEETFCTDTDVLRVLMK